MKVFACLLIATSMAAELAATAPEKTERIVSTAPNLTEILFALELGDGVIAVSDFCDFPEAAKKLPKIGGFVDPNLEALVAMQPDLVVLLASNQSLADKLARLNIKTLVVNDETVADIMSAIKSIGEACGVSGQAVELTSQLQHRLEQIRPAQSAVQPRILICFGRQQNSGQAVSFYAASSKSLYGELITLAGGTNAIETNKPLYPLLSIEGILSIDPDIVIELSEATAGHTQNMVNSEENWLGQLPAARAGNWHTIKADWAVRPGPRIVKLAETIAEHIRQWNKTRQ